MGLVIATSTRIMPSEAQILLGQKRKKRQHWTQAPKSGLDH
jgi:hypothetical protein